VLPGIHAESDALRMTMQHSELHACLPLDFVFCGGAVNAERWK